MHKFYDSIKDVKSIPSISKPLVFDIVEYPYSRQDSQLESLLTRELKNLRRGTSSEIRPCGEGPISPKPILTKNYNAKCACMTRTSDGADVPMTSLSRCIHCLHPERGRGSFGICRSMVDIVHGTVYICKKSRDMTDVQSFLVEVCALSSLSHINTVVKMVDYSCRSQSILMEQGKETLSTTIQNDTKNGVFTPCAIQDIMFRLALGLSEIAAAGWVHCDVKPQNIIRMEDNSIRLIDFGSARLLAIPQTRHLDHLYTITYRPPEIAAMAQKKDKKSCLSFGFDGLKGDIWALGITFLEFVGIVVFDLGVFRTQTEGDPRFTWLDYMAFRIGHNVFRAVFTDINLLDPDEVLMSSIDPLPNLLVAHQASERRMDMSFYQLIDRMLDPNPTTRANYTEILQHPFFTRVYALHIHPEMSITMPPVTYINRPRILARHVFNISSPSVSVAHYTEVAIWLWYMGEELGHSLSTRLYTLYILKIVLLKCTELIKSSLRFTATVSAFLSATLYERDEVPLMSRYKKRADASCNSSQFKNELDHIMYMTSGNYMSNLESLWSETKNGDKIARYVYMLDTMGYFYAENMKRDMAGMVEYAQILIENASVITFVSDSNRSHLFLPIDAGKIQRKDSLRINIIDNPPFFHTILGL